MRDSSGKNKRIKNAKITQFILSRHGEPFFTNPSLALHGDPDRCLVALHYGVASALMAPKDHCGVMFAMLHANCRLRWLQLHRTDGA